MNKRVYEVKGQLQVSVPKTKASIRRLVLPPGVVEVLRQYQKTVDSRWMFPSPVKEDMSMTPGAVRRRLQIILERAGCKRIRFHDLRHQYVKPTTKTFSENNVVSDVKPRTQLNAQCRHNIRIHAQVNLTIAY